MSNSDYIEHIARISYGKDSLKMLDVIWTRGLPLDRITTTDVWATDMVPAWLPPMQEFKDRMDQWIWDRYHIEVEHLCAMNKDGTKKTYEQMFYHVPKRRSQTVQVERERERETLTRRDQSTDSQCSVSHGVNPLSSGALVTKYKERLPDSLQTPDTTIVRNSKLSGTHIKGFPLATGITWCQNLKVRVPTPRLPCTDIQLVQETQDRLCQNPSFRRSTPQGARTEILWNIWALQRMSRHGTVR